MLGLLAHRRTLFGVLAVAAVLGLALWPETVRVDTAVVTRGPLVVTVDEEGRTRVRDRFIVATPVSGRVLRIELEPGDRVERGDVVARLDAGPAPLLDARAREEAQAAVESARAAVAGAQAEAVRARAELALAERELERARRLTAGGALAAQARDMRETEVELARESVHAAAHAVDAAAAELMRAEARRSPPRSGAAGAVVDVRAPAGGVVLRRLRESESIVPAGEPLVEVGDPAQLEIVSDLLSTDAVRVKVGARAMVEQWGYEDGLGATVRRIEPAGFTKVSALGVEEQRVNVILDLVDPGGEDVALGDNYRVDVRIVVWEAADALQVPTAALFRDGGEWAVYMIHAGRARLTRVEIGQQNGRDAEVVGGLTAGAKVIMHPPDSIIDGSRVAELNQR
jgi:HlyD family secretion protein